MKDSVERVLPHWSPDIPLYGLVDEYNWTYINLYKVKDQYLVLLFI